MLESKAPTRGLKRVDVECKAADGTWNPCNVDPFDATATAERWIKQHGEHGKVYRIITVERERKLEVTSKRVAAFA